jgi:erythrocyte band 7 integral membrane protein
LSTLHSDASLRSCFSPDTFPRQSLWFWQNQLNQHEDNRSEAAAPLTSTSSLTTGTKSNIVIPRRTSHTTATLDIQVGATPTEILIPNGVAPDRRGIMGQEETQGYVAGSEEDGGDRQVCFEWVMTIFSVLVVVCFFPLSLCFSLKIVQEYERAVIFRLGRLRSGRAKGPGIFFILPCIDNYIKVDLRTVTFDVPPQEILSKDSVTIAVDAVVYCRIYNPTMSVTNVEDALRSTRLLAATTLRNVLGTKNLAEVLSDRDNISSNMQEMLDLATDPWGVKVERVEVKDVRLPAQLQRAMAAEAEATREARAKVIAAEGEQKASRALKEAADVINESPSALQLRYLQTLSQISAEKNSTIIFPLPIELLNAFGRK